MSLPVRIAALLVAFVAVVAGAAFIVVHYLLGNPATVTYTASGNVTNVMLQEDPQNVAALAGLARCYLKSGDVARAEQTIGLVPPDKRETAAVASVRAALDLAKMAASAGDVSKLEATVKAEPANHQARIDYAMALAAGGKKEQAVDQLLASIRRDRKWNEEAARKQLVQFFDAWGPKDAATLDGRRRLSSILFS